jgi:hypothetical protein
MLVVRDCTLGIDLNIYSKRTSERARMCGRRRRPERGSLVGYRRERPGSAKNGGPLSLSLSCAPGRANTAAPHPPRLDGETYRLAIERVQLAQDAFDRPALDKGQEGKPPRAAGSIAHDGTGVDRAEMGEVCAQLVWSGGEGRWWGSERAPLEGAGRAGLARAS